MIQDFNQAWVSQHGVEFFEDGFRKVWNLGPYLDITSPTVFFGVYHKNDLEKIKNHKGPKIIIWGGNDMQPYQLQEFSKLQNQQPQTYTWAYPGEFSNILTSYNITHKPLHIAIKDYSQFKPIPLGENIYVYKGVHGNRPDHYKWDEIVKPLIKVFGEDRITFTNHLPIDELIDKVYKNCFVYVKPNPKGGCTTMWELGHMGIKTIGKSHPNIDIFTEYNDIHHLIDLIVEESKYIGKIRKDISTITKNIFTGTEWLTLKFWDE